MNKFNKIYESLLAQAAPKQSVIRDVQIGNVYVWLVKNGETYTVKKGSGDDVNRAKWKTIDSFNNYDSAIKKFYSVRKKVFDNIEKQ